MDHSQDDAQLEAGYNDAPTATPEPPKEPEQKSEQKPAETKPEPAPDPIKELTERLNRFENSHQALAGHIGGLKRSQDEIKQLLAASREATKQVPNAPTQAQVDAAVTSPAKWEQVKSQYPEWAAAHEEILEARLSKLPKPAVNQEEIDRIVEERVAQQAASVRQESIDSHLDAIVDGDWRATVASPEFQAWKAKQTPEIQSLFASDHLRDAAKALRLYEKSKVHAAPPTPEQKANSTRQRRFEAAVTPRGTGGHARSRTDVDDFEAGYNS